MAEITVGITYHNEKELLTRCLSSLMAQGFSETKVVVFDDASQFPAEVYLGVFSSVRVLRSEKNVGPAVGRNRILEGTSSPYIHFHDADDWFFPNWWGKMQSGLVNRDAVFCEVSSYSGNELVAERVVGLVDLSSEWDLVRFCLSHSMLVPCGTYLTEKLRQIGGYNEKLWQSEDIDFHVRLASQGLRYEIIPEPLVGIQIRAESRSQNFLATRLSLLQSLKTLPGILSSHYYTDLSERLIETGSQLFKLKARKEAREAFQLAVTLADPHYDKAGRLYKSVARTFGPLSAEWLSLAYRTLLPLSLRKRLHG